MVYFWYGFFQVRHYDSALITSVMITTNTKGEDNEE